MITIFFELLETLLRLYGWAVFIAVILSLLISFNVLDTRNRTVWKIHDFFDRITEPALRPIRSVLPSFGGIDFSPWVLLIAINYVLLPAIGKIEYALVAHSLQPLLY
jgi:YggT family protein